MARCGVFFFLRVRDRQTRLERQVMQLCLIRALSFAVFTHFRPSDDSKNRFINRETDSHTSIERQSSSRVPEAWPEIALAREHEKPVPLQLAHPYGWLVSPLIVSR